MYLVVIFYAIVCLCDMRFIVCKGPNIVIHQPDSVLNSMNEWCIKHHGQVNSMFLSGLFAYVHSVVRNHDLCRDIAVIMYNYFHCLCAGIIPLSL